MGDGIAIDQGDFGLTTDQNVTLPVLATASALPALTITTAENTSITLDILTTSSALPDFSTIEGTTVELPVLATSSALPDFDTDEGTVALTHLWWYEGHDHDPFAVDHDLLERHRERMLGMAGLIVPGHGAPFRV